MQNKGRQLIGKQLGTCVLEQVIGAGGMGIVYLARQLRPVRSVAVKILYPEDDLASEEQQEFLVRFRREADLIAQLDHINIMPIYEYGERDGLAYLVMPYLTGGSLRDLLTHRSPLSLEETLLYIEQAASALQYAHEHKIVHRDIKPGNMLFHADGRLLLADFGIARLIRDGGSIPTAATLTGPGHFIGSVEYMAPEMVSGQPVDARTDIYELGVVLFQMLAGRVPFQGTTPFMIAAQQVHEPPPSLSRSNPTIPASVDAVVQKALAKQPQDRYSSASEMAHALRDAITRPASANRETDAAPTFLFSHQASPSSDAWALTQEAQPHAYPVDPLLPTPPAPFIGHSQVHATSRSEPDARFKPGTMRSAGSPETPLPIDNQSRPRWLLWLIGLCLLVALLAGFALLLGPLILNGSGPIANSASPTPHGQPSSTASGTSIAQPSPGLTPSQQAQATVQTYYDAINQSQYQQAYQLWNSTYQQRHPYDQFAAGFASTRHDDIVVHAVTFRPDGTFEVAMTLYATENGASGPVVNTFEGSYIVGRENGAWKLLSAHFQPLATNTTPTVSPQGQSQAQGLVQSYYDAINRADYQSAYQLWSADYQRSHPYSQFAAGFASTQNATVTFGTITQLADGVYRVAVTVTATDKTNNGTTTTTYTGSYVVGQENGSLKLLNANLQKSS